MEPERGLAVPATGFALKNIKPIHREVASLLAQGVPRKVIAEVCDFTPEYITMLTREPAIAAILEEHVQFAERQMLALTEKAVSVVSEVMDNGSDESRLKAARLQMESAGRLGRFADSPISPVDPNHLDNLAARLVSLLTREKEGVTINAEIEDISEVALYSDEAIGGKR